MYLPMGKSERADKLKGFPGLGNGILCTQFVLTITAESFIYSYVFFYVFHRIHPRAASTPRE